MAVPVTQHKGQPYLLSVYKVKTDGALFPVS